MCAEKKEPLEKKKKREKLQQNRNFCYSNGNYFITLLKTFMTKPLQTSLFHQKSQLDKMI